MSPSQKRTYSTREVAEITGCTLRELQWWDDHRALRIRKVGHSRIWESSDVLHALIVRELRVKGIPLPFLRRRRLKLMEFAGPFLVVEIGKSLQWVESPTAVIDRMKNSRYGFLLVDVADLRAVLRSLAGDFR